MEAKFKGECIELAIDCLLTMEECCADAVSWLEKSKAFVPDESKTVQELKDALAKSIERETELENALALSEDSRDDLKSSLRKALQREGELRGKLTAYLEREQKLLTYVTSLTSVIAKAGSHLDEMRGISRAPIAVEGDPLPQLATPAFEDLMHIMAHGRDSIPPADWYTEPAEPKPAEQQTGAQFPPWYNANSEFKA